MDIHGKSKKYVCDKSYQLALHVKAKNDFRKYFQHSVLAKSRCFQHFDFVLRLLLNDLRVASKIFVVNLSKVVNNKISEDQAA